MIFGKYSCLECPCTPCASPYGVGDFCPDYSFCTTPIDLRTDLRGLTCPGDFKCEDYKNLKCPIGKSSSCSHVSECEFDCEAVGTGWFCPLQQCFARQDCEFRCVDDTHCPESIILANGGCKDQSECCPECGKNFGRAGMVGSLKKKFFFKKKIFSFRNSFKIAPIVGSLHNKIKSRGLNFLVQNCNC